MRAIVFLALTASAFAGEKNPVVPAPPPAERRTYVNFDTAYGFSAEIDGGGSSSVWEGRAQFGTLLRADGWGLPFGDKGAWWLRLGAEYARYEFDSPATLPGRLQSYSAVLGLELRLGDQVGALLELRPGVFFENEIEGGSFDCPVKFGFGIPVSEHFNLALMARYNRFAKYPVLGGIGFVWNINDTLTLSALGPEPRLTWQASRDFALWLSGEWAGGGFRTDSGAEVDYTDYRASLGTTWRLGGWTIEAAAGASFLREWDFHREDRSIETDEVAPFVKLSIRGEW